MRDLYQVDAFTGRAFEGNPACVVPDARGLDDAAMQAIAREMNGTETAFVLPATSPEATHKVRFFTRAREVALSGHGTVAAYAVLAARGKVARESVLECKAGKFGVVVDADAQGGNVTVTMTQARLAYASAPLRGAVSQSVNLPPDVVSPRPAPELVQNSGWIAMLPVIDPEVLAHAAPSPAEIRALGGSRAVDGIYVVAVDAEAGRVSQARARFFGAHGVGFVEDPATGVAAGALAGWLAKLGRLDAGAPLTVAQGVECGRPSSLLARAHADGHPRVTGAAVIVFEAKLSA